MPSNRKKFLRVTDLHAYYGESHILHGVDFDVGQGELITLLGRNGSGRTTTLNAILGLVGKRSGSIMVNGHEAINLAPHKIARLGIGFCPEDRGIFSSLSAEENLMLPPVFHSGGLRIEEIYEMFPNLYERRRTPGARLSGGEQQMLALSRILRTGAHLLLLDEITEGLAPVIVKAMGEALKSLKERGFTIILVEQNLQFAAHMANRHYVLEHGRVVEMIHEEELDAKISKLRERLGV